MTNALTEIERIKCAEQISAWDANEKELAARISQKIEAELAKRSAPPINDAPPSYIDGLMQQRFVEFCAKEGVRHCPAKPATVAAFLLSDGSRSHERML